LYLDQRKLRELVGANAKGKSVLNLYGYTGSLSVYAAAGGARSTTTVDSSSSNLDWAAQNLKLNGLSSAQNRLVRSDVMEFLATSKERYDVIIVDPPNRSINRTTGSEFAIQKDGLELLKQVVARMNAGGRAYFISHYRTLDLKAMASDGFPKLRIEEITHAITPTDFDKRLAFRAWKIEA
jgi:23S rRNA G2069 N7-methylase RlmK/C1962 C5-methylase RlmI